MIPGMKAMVGGEPHTTGWLRALTFALVANVRVVLIGEDLVFTNAGQVFSWNELDPSISLVNGTGNLFDRIEKNTRIGFTTASTADKRLTGTVPLWQNAVCVCGIDGVPFSDYQTAVRGHNLDGTMDPIVGNFGTSSLYTGGVAEEHRVNGVATDAVVTTDLVEIEGFNTSTGDTVVNVGGNELHATRVWLAPIWTVILTRNKLTAAESADLLIPLRTYYSF